MYGRGLGQVDTSGQAAANALFGTTGTSVDVSGSGAFDPALTAELQAAYLQGLALNAATPLPAQSPNNNAPSGSPSVNWLLIGGVAVLVLLVLPRGRR